MLDSHYLSYLLRHHPEDKGLTLDENGWCDVDQLLEALDIYMDELERVVNSNTRFIFNEGKTKIKAAHGHSVNVKYENSKEPPNILYHGTSKDNLDSILTKGISKMSRTAIHLSSNIETAKRVGLRHCTTPNDLIILAIDAKRMHEDGIEFHESEDGVWLVTDAINPKYVMVLDKN